MTATLKKPRIRPAFEGPVLPEFTAAQIRSTDLIQKRLDEQAAQRPGQIDHDLRRKLLAIAD